MKFNIDEKVMLNGTEGVIFNYSSRYKDYEIKLGNGKIIRGVKEDELTVAGVGKENEG